MASFFDHDHTGLAVLTLNGPAGAGKTTLWREGIRMAGTPSLPLM